MACASSDMTQSGIIKLAPRAIEEEYVTPPPIGAADLVDIILVES